MAPGSPIPISSLTPTKPLEQVNIQISQRSIAATLLKAALVLVVCYLVVLADRFIFTDISLIPRGYAFIFDLNREGNLPSYFSAVLLLFSAVLLAIVAGVQQGSEVQQFVSGRSRFVRHWQALSLIFLGLSIDEAVSLHEKTIRPLRALLGAGGIFYFTWVVPAIVLLIVLLLVYRKFLLALSPATRRGVLLAGGIYILGGVGIEMLSGLWVSANGRENLTYGLLVLIEESLEMVGLIVFISVLLSLLRSSAERVAFQFGKSK